MRKITLLLAIASFLCIACSPKNNQEPVKENVVLEEQKPTDQDSTKDNAEPEESKAAVQNSAKDNVVPESPKETEEVPEIDGKLEPKGLVLEMGARPEKNVEIHHRSVTEHGPYKIQEMYDGLVTFSTERLKKQEISKESLEAMITSEDDSSREFTIEKDDAMSTQVGHTAWKITYMTGHNEDTTRHVDYYFQTDQFDYRFNTSIGADWFDDNKPTIDKWFSGLKFVDKN